MTAHSDQRSARTQAARRQARAIAWVIAGVVGVVLLFVFGYFFFADPPGKIRITEPEDGSIVPEPVVFIRGTSSPDWAGVFRIDGGRNEPVQVGKDGDWEYRATLNEGRNTLEFHLGSHYGQSDSVTITFEPP